MSGSKRIPIDVLKKSFGSRLWYEGATVPDDAEYLLLWVQQSVRVRENHALAAAIMVANQLDLPLYAYFGIDPHYMGANARHFDFLFQGLADLESSLAALGIPLLLDRVVPYEGVARAAKGAACVVGDRGYTRVQRNWRGELKKRLDVPFILLESDIVVPVGQASQKEEYAAATLRPKLKRLTELYLAPVHLPPLKKRRSRATPLPFSCYAPISPAEARSRMTEIGINPRVGVQGNFSGGEGAAQAALEGFVDTRLPHYSDSRNDPGLNLQSELSPYLHFGQLSPITAALAVMEASAETPGLMEGAAGFLEQLIVRRELAINFCVYNSDYDSSKAIPVWARTNLDAHANDLRPYDYSREELIHGESDDPYWNAAQKELVMTGKMHGYMRMYWGKKILEWMSDWREAYEFLIELNDAYSLDGRDPNGYAGIAWIFGKHDRPFKERPCFGKLRPMVANGLKRKFEMELYLARVEGLAT